MVMFPLIYLLFAPQNEIPEFQVLTFLFLILKKILSLYYLLTPF